MASITAIAYLVSAVLFILALRSWSHPATPLTGINYGIIGMVLAIGTTLLLPQLSSYQYIIPGIVIGGIIGTVIAKRIPMTALPQLMAAFHSLVGLAAVCVAAAAFY